MAKVRHIPPPGPGERWAVISDIHGELRYLRGLLEKPEVAGADRLLFLGDMAEKGPESLAVLRLVMALCREGRALALLGNCDAWHMELDRSSEEMHRWVRKYMLSPPPGACPGLLAQMCLECGFPLSEDMDREAMHAALETNFPEELGFLRSLPHIIDAGDYVFVHGGLPPEGEDWESADGWKCMKCDRFAARDRRFDRWVICGHTPVQLYREDITNAAPIIDAERRIISIDGGCVLKDDGQLNALLIEDGRIGCTWYDPFPLCRALEAQPPSARSRYIPWGDNRVERLSAADGFCRIRQISSGYELEVPEDFLFERDGQLLVNDCTDYRPAVAPGDVFSLVRETARGAWIKKDGVSGWYAGRFERL